MSVFKKTIIRHWWAMIAALLIGAFTYWPHLAFEKNLGPANQGITKSFVNDDLYYLARGQEVIDGHPTLANPCLAEHKNGLPMQFWLPDYLLSKPLAVLGIPVEQGYNFYAFLLPIFSALLTYAAGYALVGSRKLALTGALFLNAVLFFHVGGRLPSPGFNFIFWLTLVNLLIAYLKTDKKLVGILAALNLGLLFYIYPYYWTFGLILLAIIMVAGKIWLPRFKLKNYLFILLGAVIIGTGYFWELWQSAKLDTYQETMARLGLLNTHFPSGLTIVISSLLIGGLLLFLSRKKIIQVNPLFILLGSGALASLVAVNQHVITGQNLEFSSHYWQISAFSLVLTAVYCLQFILYKITELPTRKIVRKAALLIMIGWSLAVILPAVRAMAIAEPEDIYRQSYAPIFAWLTANTLPETVVYANQDLSVYLPIYTANNVYYHQTCALFFMADAEAQSRFAVNHYFDSLTGQEILKDERSIWGTRYINAYAHNQSKNKLRKIIGLKPVDYEKIPPTEIERVNKLFQEIKQLDFRTALQSYRVDYLLWDKKNDPHWDLDRFNFLEEIYNDGNFTIYKIN